MKMTDFEKRTREIQEKRILKEINKNFTNYMRKEIPVLPVGKLPRKRVDN